MGSMLFLVIITYIQRVSTHINSSAITLLIKPFFVCAGTVVLIRRRDLSRTVKFHQKSSDRHLGRDGVGQTVAHSLALRRPLVTKFVFVFQLCAKYSIDESAISHIYKKSRS